MNARYTTSPPGRVPRLASVGGPSSVPWLRPKVLPTRANTQSRAPLAIAHPEFYRAVVYIFFGEVYQPADGQLRSSDGSARGGLESVVGNLGSSECT